MQLLLPTPRFHQSPCHEISINFHGPSQWTCQNCKLGLQRCHPRKRQGNYLRHASHEPQEHAPTLVEKTPGMRAQTGFNSYLNNSLSSCGACVKSWQSNANNQNQCQIDQIDSVLKLTEQTSISKGRFPLCHACARIYIRLDCLQLVFGDFSRNSWNPRVQKGLPRHGNHQLCLEGHQHMICHCVHVCWHIVPGQLPSFAKNLPPLQMERCHTCMQKGKKANLLPKTSSFYELLHMSQIVEQHFQAVTVTKNLCKHLRRDQCANTPGPFSLHGKKFLRTGYAKHQPQGPQSKIKAIYT